MPLNRKRQPSWAEHLPPSHRGPAARRAAVAMLTAGALVGVTAFSLSPLPAELGLTALGCNQGKAAHTLAAARETRSQTRALLADLAVSNDTRAQGLAREIAGLGFTPATQPAGWRQKAVDVSDQLNALGSSSATADPHLRQVAARLARAGLGPTPADMLPKQPPPPEPGPIGELGQTLGGAADGAVDAVTGAGEAVKNVTAPKPAADSSTSASGPAAPNPRRQAEPPLPETCLSHAEATTAPAAAAPAAPAARPAPQKPAPAPAPTAPAAPTSSAAEPTPTPEPPSTSPDDDAAAQPDTGSSTSSEDPPAGDSDNNSDDSTDDTTSSSPEASTEPSTDSSDSSSDDTPATPDDTSGVGSADSESGGSSSSTSSNSSSGGGSAQDLEKARVAIQLVGELMQALGASPDPGAGDLRTSVLGSLDRDKLEKLGADPADLDKLDQLGDLTDQGGGSPHLSGPDSSESGSDRDSTSSTPSETPSGGSSDSESSSSSDSSTGSGSNDPGGSGTGSGSAQEPSTESAGTGSAGDAWEAGAEKLAEQVHQAADADPLAEQLAEKLDAAGIGSQNETGSSPSATADSGSAEPDEQGAGQGSSDGAEQPSTGGGDSTGTGSGGSQKGSGAAQQPQAGDPIQRPGATGSGTGSGTGSTGSTDAAQPQGSQGQDDTTSSGDGASSGNGAAGGGADGAGTPPGRQDQAGNAASADGEQPRDPEKAQAAAADDTAGEGARAATWDRLAQCESGGDWAIDTGNGYSGVIRTDDRRGGSDHCWPGLGSTLAGIWNSISATLISRLGSP
ncbi:transglycosylase family protein [Pseudonocardia alni]|uniref:Resuscitation-promoting factor core lysozyme-like domain-containing protein n=1 Tax=Pseudonocardia alni TaxID=33907 RepID=A0A852W8M8_PSEA5|nr:transglycosylase family protein [Pseudonocardia antarctica]NYG05343.1 hypothetical protein [Pseudonocardia antarctica]